MKIEDVKVGMLVKTDYGEGTVTGLTGYGFAIVKVGKAQYAMGPSALTEAIPGYTTLSAILAEALTRASEGKGKDRHANGKPFDEQPIVTLNLTLGSQDGPLFQIQKKCAEASRFYAAGERERAENELLDCIVYAVGAVITGRKR